MVQVDLEMLKVRWYELGTNNRPVDNDNRLLFNSLDTWQRKELEDAYTKGRHDHQPA
jgi:hypothetical protein